ncbi:MAG: hypothetical protein L0220_04550, partial [Acidobacteria bacterium]|nr:hypothetical protein [Acidobacteriota bacterium]
MGLRETRNKRKITSGPRASSLHVFQRLHLIRNCRQPGTHGLGPAHLIRDPLAVVLILGGVVYLSL